MAEFILIEGDTIESLQRVYNPAKVQKAAQQTTNRITDRVNTLIGNMVRADWNVKKRSITERVNVRRASSGRPSASLLYFGSRVSMMSFGAKPINVKSKPYPDGGRRRRKGVAVTIKRGNRVRIKNKPIFIAPANGKEHVFKRIAGQTSSTGRDKLQVLAVLSVPEMTRKQETVSAAQQFVQQNFPVEFERNMNRLLGGRRAN